MRPIEFVLVGFAIVILDLRIEGVDLIADPLGYAVAAFGAMATARVGFPRAWALAAAVGFGVAALLAVPGMIAHRPIPRGVYLHPVDALGLVQSLELAAASIGLAALLVGVERVARAAGAEGLAAGARRVAWAFAVLVALGLLLDVAWALAGPGDTWPFALAHLVAGLVAFVAALVLLWRARALGPPPRAGEPAPSAPPPEPI